MKLKNKHLILSSVLTLAMAITAICGGINTAYATEVTPVEIKDGSLTVNVNDGSAKYLDSILKNKPDSKIVYDLYQVATLNENKIKQGDSEFETFYFDVNKDFDTLVSSVDIDKAIKEAKDQKAYQELAKACLGDMFGGEGATVTKLASGTEYELIQTQTIKPGMYLLVARGTGDCVTTLKKVAGGSKNTEKNSTLEDALPESYATSIKIDGTEFICSPILFTLPYKKADGASVNDETAWTFDRALTLKMEANRKTGSIVIDKTLVGFSEGEEDATCVFRVTVYDSEAKSNVTSDTVYALKFTEEGHESLTVDGIPYGSYVEVTEEYSGGAYKVDKVTDSKVLVEGDEKPVFAFTNTVTHDKGGGGLVNYFSYEKSNPDDQITWTLNKGKEGEDKDLDNRDTQNGTPNEN